MRVSQNLGVRFFGVPIIRIIVFGGLSWGPYFGSSYKDVGMLRNNCSTGMQSGLYNLSGSLVKMSILPFRQGPKTTITLL